MSWFFSYLVRGMRGATGYSVTSEVLDFSTATYGEPDGVHLLSSSMDLSTATYGE
jgi:hypothetical protein